ncbi:MAG: succinate dehydrogenase cytochrome b subunit [Polyangiaceae bacterium]|nr:succinate dehydrogenase cytochrome b subunit [Polyangiaceae bacterium]
MLRAMSQINAWRDIGPSGLKSLFSQTVGLKVLMAVTGLALVGFLVAHLAGNALIFVGPEAINAYSAELHAHPELLWAARLGLLASVCVHIVCAFKLWMRNKDARPVGYKVRKDAATTYAARTMYISGPIVFFYLFYHLAHLTFGTPMGDYEHSSTDVYANLVNGFQIPWVAVSYMLANLCVGFHIYHGIWSMTQSIGLNSPKVQPRLRSLSAAAAILLTLGNISIPLSVWLGLVG